MQDFRSTVPNWQHVGYEETYHNEPEYCYSATLDEIEQKGWSLVPSKYIEFRNRDEQIDFDTKMRQLQTEMRHAFIYRPFKDLPFSLCGYFAAIIDGNLVHLLISL